MPATLASVSLLTAADRCDRCTAQARVLAVLNSGGELLFCGHHGRVHREALEKIAVYLESHVDVEPEKVAA